MNWGESLGAIYLSEGQCFFRVWAPYAQRVEVHIVAPQEQWFTLEKDPNGYHQALVGRTWPGTRYCYQLDGGEEWPDPASRFQPEGVGGPSEVVDSAFEWEERGWLGHRLGEYIIYELHVGAFTTEGNFEAIVPRLPYLKSLGITAIELMPIAQFPGSHNWGYDGVYPFAAQNSYGGPAGLKRLVNACHQQELAIVLDVVYNHLGPEGNYTQKFGPYFHNRYLTPWGDALNFDGPDNEGVRRFFIQSALYWIDECHIDALRLDAVHAIMDQSAIPFLEEMAGVVHEQAQRSGRRIYIVAESDLNDTRLLRSSELGGFDYDAQWTDDFHHALHALLTREQSGYYRDFGRLEQLATAFEEGYVYSGQFSSCRRGRHGRSSRAIPAGRFIVCAQNHDQVGNRMMGERLSSLVPFPALKLAAAAVLFSPYVPLLFMGEEYGETAPFLYFTSHSDPELVAAVRRGRKEEFMAFTWRGEAPDPQSEETFQHSRLRHDLRRIEPHRSLLQYYRRLIELRKTVPALAHLDKESLRVEMDGRANALALRRWHGDSHTLAIFHFGSDETVGRFATPDGLWRKLLDSEDPAWQGSGKLLPATSSSDGEISLTLQPYAVALFEKGEK